MTDEARSILDYIVSNQKVKSGGGYPISVLQSKAFDLIGPQSASAALRELFDSGYLKEYDGWFVLTDLGYKAVCDEKSIRGTQKRIIRFIHGYSAAPERAVSSGVLRNFAQNLSGCRLHHFDEALQDLDRKGIVTIDSHGTVNLTGIYLSNEDELLEAIDGDSLPSDFK